MRRGSVRLQKRRGRTHARCWPEEAPRDRARVGRWPLTFGGNGCSRDVAVWLAHAENDETVPFESGADSRDRWRSTNGCSDATEPVDPSPCVEYGGCSAGLPKR
jgi:hypothetical protein